MVGWCVIKLPMNWAIDYWILDGKGGYHWGEWCDVGCRRLFQHWPRVGLMNKGWWTFCSIFFRSLLALTKILFVSTSMARCNNQINYLFLMMHETMSFLNSQFKIIENVMYHCSNEIRLWKLWCPIQHPTHPLEK